MTSETHADAMAATLKPVRSLECCCCGGRTRGRQWWNRDAGYGLCVACIDYCARGVTAEEFRSYYGVRGTHFDVSETHAQEIAQ